MLTAYRPHQRARRASASILVFALVASWAARLNGSPRRFSELRKGPRWSSNN